MNISSLAQPFLIAPLALLVLQGLPAQNVFHGNGIPSAYVENTPAVLGQQLVLRFGSPTTPLPFTILSLSDGIGPVFIPDPLFGNIGLNVLSPAYVALGFGLDPFGDGIVTIPLPPLFQPPASPPLFLNALTLESNALSISKTVRLDWANANGWEPAASLGTARQLHTATALGSGPRDNTTEVLITGGATNSFVVPVPMASCELFSPLTRTVSALPSLSMPRSCHRAVRLLDGRVLIAGGMTTGGLVTNTCELFDPVTQTFSPGPTMNAPRAGHAITLLDDGRVLVTGGVADWQNTATAFIAALNTAQFTAEILDATATAWTPLPNMSSKRLGHSQTKLANGRVLIVGGICGGYGGWASANYGQPPGQIAQYTNTCQVFDPATGVFLATAALPVVPTVIANPGRAFHGASLLPNGNVLITGGFAPMYSGAANDETIVVDFCDVWNPPSGTWSSTAPLPQPAAFHGQHTLGAGAFVCGGFSGALTSLSTTAACVFHDGVACTQLSPIGVDPTGTPQPRGGHSVTPLYDGTFLVYGGGVWPNTLGDGWIYTP